MLEDSERTRPLSRSTLVLLSLGGTLFFAGFVALGLWQFHRLGWKLDLIARVERQLAAPPTAAPGREAWSAIGQADQYRRVVVEGVFDHARETCSQAVTALGPGCWVMTPLHTTAGWWLLVNRGYVDDAHRNAAARHAGQVAGTVRVEGLLRLSEPGGGFLRRNDPVGNRWHSRDVAAIAAARSLPAAEVAPYFIDASDTTPGGPVGGLTVVRFHNNHLVYALTWFGLAAMVLVAGLHLWRREQRLRRATRVGY